MTEAIRSSKGPEDALKTLADLRVFLSQLPVQTASTVLLAFLDEKTDAPTRIEFSVGSGGTLTGAPSLRVCLLDYLGELDPRNAARYAEKVLQESHSPDEWAVSLRNYARENRTPAGQAFLRQKSREMVRNEAWRKDPAAGFLEAFDVFVFTKDTAATPLLAELVREPGERPTSYAAYLTLDRLVIAEPQAIFEQIEQQPGLFKGRELMQSNFFARADVQDSKQRTQLERYLLDPGRTTAELEAFAGIYPNSNYMISTNLLTSTPTPNHAELVVRDRAALKVAGQWLADSRFQRIQPHVQTIKNRLETFVSPTGTSSKK